MTRQVRAPPCPIRPPSSTRALPIQSRTALRSKKAAPPRPARRNSHALPKISRLRSSSPIVPSAHTTHHLIPTHGTPQPIHVPLVLQPIRQLAFPRLRLPCFLCISVFYFSLIFFHLCSSVGVNEVCAPQPIAGIGHVSP